jgi:hypothetical protein
LECRASEVAAFATAFDRTEEDQTEEINQSIVELFDAATALRDAVEKAMPIIEAIEAR